jgi:uncharacterized protein YceH (UPF0502 family)
MPEIENSTASSPPVSNPLEARVARLESDVAELRERLEKLRLQ